MEVKPTTADFAYAAARAVEAGADTVEVHAANGYPVHQFLAPDSHDRTGKYGGSMLNLARFTKEVARAVADAIEPEKAPIRPSPGLPTGGIADGQDKHDLYRCLPAEFETLGLEYLHVPSVRTIPLADNMRQMAGDPPRSSSVPWPITWSNEPLFLSQHDIHA